VTAQPPTPQQLEFWNEWNSSFREDAVGEVSRRQADVILGWLEATGRRDLDILEAGCGSGWFSAELTAFGRVTAVDLADEVLERAQRRLPSVRFLAGDFLELDVEAESADVVVTLEVLPHVADQRAFIAKIARVLRPGGSLMMATQNRFVLERRDVAPRGDGQLRRWLGRGEVRRLLEADFDAIRISSVTPDGYLGVLRPINSPTINGLVARVVPQARLDAAKERLGLGRTLMVRAEKPRR
jgi:SAM-dependent methyltransferase